MKRAKGLWPQIHDRDNLRLATIKAMRGKRNRYEVRRFTESLELNLGRMSDEIKSGSIQVGRYHQFIVHDPKERVITAPCFEERILHHAIMNACEPVLERWFIHDTYACRVGRGRNKAVQRARNFASANSAFLKFDIRKYFDSIPHTGLLSLLARIFSDQRLLELFERIIRAFRGSIGKGLPIGSLTSQHFANFYLGVLDRYAKETLRVRHYVRYMDDMVFWASSTDALKGMRDQAVSFLERELGLICKDSPFINHTKHGMDFLGCRVWPTHITLNRRSRVRFVRRLKALEADYALGNVDELELQSRSNALTAFTQAAGVSSWQFRQSALQRMIGGWSQGLEPGEPRRQLEQHAGELPVGEP